ncbi:MAG: hypothetical protein BWY43_00673 [candidate division WS2 bacterium ADurb.Bin280]|uniref:Uncharacterized protein n=1 Tax=candidate division WS2 bacterium ADurb.Bin280 TaxID=1852829 RepID=A0A1V5SC32_9BACT|nr:MAG: hypothetical protein BWY43_00673 [candidate division WS2 bacterium ADurb.Bin280]
MAEKKDKKSTIAELRYEAMSTFTTLFTSAFGLVAALAWNETVKEAIDRYITPGAGLKSKLIYAILVTALAVIVSFQLGKLTARFKSDAED